jgi:signal transduction histidine kinase
MRLLRDVPIRRKLMLIIMLTTGGALLLAGIGLLALDFFRFRKEMVTDLQTLAEIVAQNSTAVLSFRDPATAQEDLSALRVKPSLQRAALYDVDGRPFAQWVRPGFTQEIPGSPGPDGPEFLGAGALVLFEPIILDDQRIGTVYLESGLDQMWSRLRARVITVLIVFLAAAAAAFAVSTTLQTLISRPILDLARTARGVSERNDYSLRAEKQSADELGRLVDAFNQMLAQIEERDTALLAAKGELEHRVEERTHELRSANVELQQSNRDLDDFAYIASHDLKEPLRGIHNYSMFLLEDYGDKLDGEGKAKLETLMRLTRRMEVLIDSLLQFSRLGRADLAIDEIDLGRTVAEVVDSLGINLKQEEVEIRIPRPLPTVRADRARVGEIFYNLIVNAVRYNDKLRKWVEIGWLEGDPPTFYVRDNGIGIQEKHFDSIFRIFKRLHSRDRFGDGTGAGLTIVKKIVERHSGRIWLDSTPGEGTTFYFTLARGDSVAEDAEPADPADRG